MTKVKKLKKFQEFKDLGKTKTDDITKVKDANTAPAEVFDAGSLDSLTTVGIPKDYPWEEADK